MYIQHEYKILKTQRCRHLTHKDLSKADFSEFYIRRQKTSIDWKILKSLRPSIFPIETAYRADF